MPSVVLLDDKLGQHRLLLGRTDSAVDESLAALHVHAHGAILGARPPW